MRDQVKRPDDDLLIVHKPALPVDKAGREPASPDAEALPADVEALVERLTTSVDADARSRLLRAIQSRFGNAFAARVIDGAQRRQVGGPLPGNRGPAGDDDR